MAREAIPASVASAACAASAACVVVDAACARGASGSCYRTYSAILGSSGAGGATASQGTAEAFLGTSEVAACTYRPTMGMGSVPSGRGS